VLRGPDDTCAVAVLAGDARIDFRGVASAMGWKEARLAPPALVLKTTGYPAGGVPPLGHRTSLPVLVDEAMMDSSEGYAGGGRPELLLKIRPSEIVRVAKAKVARIAA